MHLIIINYIGSIFMSEKVIDQLKEIIAEQLDVNIQREEITPDAPLFEEGLGLDSIAIVEFITLIEEQFDFEFEEHELDMAAFKDIRTVANFISTKREPAIVG